MIAINECVKEDLGSGPGTVERNELPEDPHLSLTWLQMTVKRLEGQLVNKDEVIASLAVTINKNNRVMDELREELEKCQKSMG